MKLPPYVEKTVKDLYDEFIKTLKQEDLKHFSEMNFVFGYDENLNIIHAIRFSEKNGNLKSVLLDSMLVVNKWNQFVDERHFTDYKTKNIIICNIHKKTLGLFNDKKQYKIEFNIDKKFKNEREILQNLEIENNEQKDEDVVM